MPYRHRTPVTRVLPRVVMALSAVVAAATIGAASSAADPAPNVDPKLSHRIGAVNAELDRLSRQNDQLDEQYNLAAAAVTAARRTATHDQQAAERAAARYRAAHARFMEAAAQQYESGPDPSLGALLTSGAPQQYLDGVSMANYLSGAFAAAAKSQRAVQADAVDASRRATEALKAARAKQAALAQRRTALQQQSQRFQQLLDTLTAKQRRERAHARAVAAAKARAELAAQQAAANPQPGAGASPVASPVSSPAAAPVPAPASGSVQQVISFAEAQVGKTYSYGASGPDAYDCSGLTMAAWAQAGVQLPHSAAEQYNYGTHIAYSQLQPGDLIFLYQPIGHVEIYVGHDLAVSAADPSIGIVYVHPSHDMADYTGATRVSG